MANLLCVGKGTEMFHCLFGFDIVTDLRLTVFMCLLETEISLQIYQKTVTPVGSQGYSKISKSETMLLQVSGH